MYNSKNPFVSKITADFCIGAIYEQHKENNFVCSHILGRTFNYAISCYK